MQASDWARFSFFTWAAGWNLWDFLGKTETVAGPTREVSHRETGPFSPVLAESSPRTQLGQLCLSVSPKPWQPFEKERWNSVDCRYYKQVGVVEREQRVKGPSKIGKPEFSQEVKGRLRGSKKGKDGPTDSHENQRTGMNAAYERNLKIWSPFYLLFFSFPRIFPWPQQHPLAAIWTSLRAPPFLPSPTTCRTLSSSTNHNQSSWNWSWQAKSKKTNDELKKLACVPKNSIFTSTTNDDAPPPHNPPANTSSPTLHHPSDDDMLPKTDDDGIRLLLPWSPWGTKLLLLPLLLHLLLLLTTFNHPPGNYIFKNIYTLLLALTFSTKSISSSYPSPPVLDQDEDRPRKRREMQAITKIVETREFPYQDEYFWKNNGNTTQKKTGCKSIYYKCSNSNKVSKKKGRGEICGKFFSWNLRDGLIISLSHFRVARWIRQ